jgi:penicillin amidase
MNKYLKFFLGITLIFIPIIAVLGLIFNNITKKSYYPYSGNIAINGISSQVKIYYDNYGVPHVFASNSNDAYFTQGYLHAQNRLWQMDLSRRVTEGRLSEIFGSATLEVDKLFKTIGIHRFSYAWYDSLSPASKQILISYSNGVNKFIETHYDNLPVEFDALNYKPDLWKPVHSLMLARLMAWDLNLAWYTDYIIAEIINKTGLEKTSLMFPDTSITLFKIPSEIPIDTVQDTDKQNTILFNNNQLTNLNTALILGKYFFEYNKKYIDLLNINVSHSASNSWVVSGEKSLNGFPILANDPHLAFQAPSRWYEMLINNGSNSVRGMSFPGIPCIVIGNNQFISWGLTNLMNDDCDFLLLNKDSLNEHKYLYKGNSYPIDSLIENIYVKDSLNSEFTIYLTKIGPVISNLNFRGYAFSESNKVSLNQNKILTFKWTGYEFSDDIKCFDSINNAKSWIEFKNALKYFSAPAQNFIYADKFGNIGYKAAGFIPIRNNYSDFSYIFPNENELDWTGYADFEKLPELYNPKNGYIVTANTNPYSFTENSKEKFYISYLWEDDSRFNSIKSMLNSKSKFDAEDFKLIQNNNYSPYFVNLKNYLYSDSLIEKDFDDDTQKKVLNILKFFDGNVNANDPSGTILNTFFIYLLKNIYNDELGDEVFNNFITIPNIPFRSLEKILKENNNIWFDNINTPSTETRRDILKLSIKHTSEYLKNKFSNSDPYSWHWGKIHIVKIKHPFGFIESLDKSFNIGPFSAGGDQTTINNTEYSISNVINKGNYDAVVGASMRMIVDFSNLEQSWSINSTGQSGQPLHSNYSDQSRLWANGYYKKNIMNEIEMLEKKYNLLVLLPE